MSTEPQAQLVNEPRSPRSRAQSEMHRARLLGLQAIVAALEGKRAAIACQLEAATGRANGLEAELHRTEAQVASARQLLAWEEAEDQ